MVLLLVLLSEAATGGILQKAVLKNFEKFKGKQLFRGLFLKFENYFAKHFRWMLLYCFVSNEKLILANVRQGMNASRNFQQKFFYFAKLQNQEH